MPKCLPTATHVCRYHRQEVAEKHAQEHTGQAAGGHQELTGGQRDAREGVPFTTAAAVEADTEGGLAGKLLGTTPDVVQVRWAGSGGLGNNKTWC
jgi:hypothetical protein